MDKAPLPASSRPIPSRGRSPTACSTARRCARSTAWRRLARRPAGAGVLEIGGGRSGLAALLYPGAEITTLDRTPPWATGRQEHSVYVCGDACRLPFADGAFDAVTLFDVLEHIADDGVATREALRVTRPGGWLLVSTPNADWHYPTWASCAAGARRRRTDAGLGPRAARLRPAGAGAPVRHGAAAHAGFVNRADGLGHDLAFSNLPVRSGGACSALLSTRSPGRLRLQPEDRPGSEIAALRKPDLPAEARVTPGSAAAGAGIGSAG